MEAAMANGGGRPQQWLSGVKIGWASRQLISASSLAVDKIMAAEALEEDRSSSSSSSVVISGDDDGHPGPVSFFVVVKTMGAGVSGSEGVVAAVYDSTDNPLGIQFVGREGSPIVNVGEASSRGRCSWYSPRPHGRRFRAREGGGFRGDASLICRPVGVAGAQKVGQDNDERGDAIKSSLRHQFNEVNGSGTGTLDEEQLRRATDNLRLPTAFMEVEGFVHSTGPVAFEDFALFAMGLETKLRSTFMELDKQKTGVLPKEDIMEVLRRYNITPRKVYQSERLVRRKLGKSVADGFRLDDLRSYLLWVRDEEQLLASNVGARASMDTGGDSDVSLPVTLATTGGGRLGGGGGGAGVKFPTMRDVLAASISGAVARILIAPLERVRLLQMVYPRAARETARAVLRGIRLREGNRGVLRGSMLNVLKVFPAKAVEAVVFSALSGDRYGVMARASRGGGGANKYEREKLQQDTSLVGKPGSADVTSTFPSPKQQGNQGISHDWHRNAVATLASSAGVLASHPIDTLRVAVASQIAPSVRPAVPHTTAAGGVVVAAEKAGRGLVRAAAGAGKSPGAVEIARGIVRRQGVKGFYHGVGANLLRTVPYLFLSGYVCAAMERWYRKKAGRPDAEVGPARIVLYATAAALCAQTVFFPLETAQRRLQLQAAISPAAGRLYYSGVLDALRRIVREEGVGALFSGIGANHMRLLPAAAISFATHKKVRKICDAF